MPEQTANTPIHEDGITGHCLCSSITITLTQKDLFTSPNGHTCHCTNCRKFTGSTQANILRLPARNIQMTDRDNTYTTYTDTNTRSGDPLTRGFCARCGCGVGRIPESAGGRGEGEYAFVMLGLFPKMPRPEFELFTTSRLEFVREVEGAGQWEFLRSREARGA